MTDGCDPNNFVYEEPSRLKMEEGKTKSQVKDEPTRSRPEDDPVAQKDGGPAHPVYILLPEQTTKEQIRRVRDAVNEKKDYGLSVRDAFAIAALQGCLAESAHPQSRGLANDPIYLAKLSFKIADAMLAERVK